MEDVSFAAVILIGVWVFFVTARRRNSNTSLTEKSAPERELADAPSSESDTWSFEPESNDRGAIEQSDHWVLN